MKRLLIIGRVVMGKVVAEVAADIGYEHIDFLGRHRSRGNREKYLN